jgi:hypothetical protein
MTEVESENLKKKLFLAEKRNYGKEYSRHVIVQYRLYVEMADRISSRRAKANEFFVSVNTALIATISILAELKPSLISMTFWWVLATSFAGILVCWTWLSTISSYRQLNSGKFKIINAIEQELPLAMYNAEWAYLKPKGGVAKYNQLTNVERWVPKIFATLYFVLLIIASYLMLRPYLVSLFN